MWFLMFFQMLDRFVYDFGTFHFFQIFVISGRFLNIEVAKLLLVEGGTYSKNTRHNLSTHVCHITNNIIKQKKNEKNNVQKKKIGVGPNAFLTIWREMHLYFSPYGEKYKYFSPYGENQWGTVNLGHIKIMFFPKLHNSLDN